MRKLILIGLTAAVFAGSSAVAVYAQHRPGHHHQRMSLEDRSAFADARIAAVHAGLKLNPDQEKMWPAVETAVRDFARMRIDRANARMEARRDDDRDASRGRDRDREADNPIVRLQQRADAMAATASALKKIAEAADPLYRTLDDGQKRRLMVLTRMEHRFGHGGWTERRFDREFDRGERERDRGGPDGDRGRGGSAPERL